MISINAGIKHRVMCQNAEHSMATCIIEALETVIFNALTVQSQNDFVIIIRFLLSF